MYSFSVKKYCPLAVTAMKVSDTDNRKVMLLTECSLQYCESSQEEAFWYFYLYTRLVIFEKLQIAFPYSSANWSAASVHRCGLGYVKWRVTKAKGIVDIKYGT